MSSTIEIIPVENKTYTFDQICSLSQQKLNAFLKKIGVGEMTISATLRDEEESYSLGCNPEASFNWQENEYIWFTINDIDGGIQVYKDQIKDELIDPTNPWWCLDDLKQCNTSITDLDQRLEKVKIVDTCWYVNRNFGMQAIFYVLQGCISEALAELSQGIIWNEDGAWEMSKFPTLSIDFSSWYLNADATEEEYYRELAKDCIKEIKEKFS